MNVLVLLGSLRPESTNRQLANAALAHLPESARAHVSTLPAGLPSMTRAWTPTSGAPRSSMPSGPRSPRRTQSSSSRRNTTARFPVS